MTSKLIKLAILLSSVCLAALASYRFLGSRTGSAEMLGEEGLEINPFKIGEAFEVADRLDPAACVTALKLSKIDSDYVYLVGLKVPSENRQENDRLIGLMKVNGRWTEFSRYPRHEDAPNSWWDDLISEDGSLRLNSAVVIHATSLELAESSLKLENEAGLSVFIEPKVGDTSCP